MPIGVGGGGKASGNFDAPAAELAHHLPDRGVLAADGRHVASPYLLEPAYVVGSHFCLRGKLRQDTIRAIQRALEDAGCEFIIEDECGGAGMRLRKHVRRRLTSRSAGRVTAGG